MFDSRPRRSSALLGAFTGALVLGLGAATAIAQDAAGPSNDRDRADAAKPATAGDPIRVYTPIKNMDEVLNKEGGGVFLPYRELLRLLDEARAATGHPGALEEPAPPEPFVFVGARYKGSADEGVVRFEGTFEFEVLEKHKWVEIPLGLGNRISLEDVRTADGKRAIVRPTADGSFAVLVQGAGPLSLIVRFAVAVNKQKPGERSFSITLPRAALSTFEVDLPERGLRVDVQPSLGQSLQDVADAGKTRVTAYLGAGGNSDVSVTWYPRPKDDAGPGKSLVFSELSTSLWLDEGIAKAFAIAKYSVEQAPTDTFRIAMPKDWKILQVNADGLREHEVTEQGGQQVLRVSFHERVKQALVTFRLERTREDSNAPVSKFDFPAIRTLDAERETGVVCAASSAFLKLEASKISGLSQIDANEIPPALGNELRNDPNATADRPPLGFHFLKNEWKLELSAAKVEPEVEGKVYAIATVKDDELSYAGTVEYTIKKRGIFSVAIKLPAGFNLVDVGDETTVKSTSAGTTASDGSTVYTIELTHQVKPGTFRLPLWGTLARKDLARVDLPVVALQGVVKETGILAVAAQRHLKLTSSGQPAGLVPMPVADLATAGFPYAPGDNEELTFGFKYGKPGAAAAFEVAKREPKVTATVETVANADLDRITVDGDILYNVEFAGVDKLALRVPARLNTEEAFKITADGNIIKERKCSAPDKEKPSDTVTWTVELQSKHEGNFRLHYRYEIKLDKLAAGEVRTVGLDEVEVLGASERESVRETGDIVLLKHENLVITDSDTTGLEARDAAKELPDSLARLGGFRGYHYVAHPWKLALQIIKYDFQAPLAKIIEHLHLDEVVLRDGTINCEAWIRLRNNQGQFLRVYLPKGFEAQSPLRVGDKNVTPSTVASDGKGPAGIDIMLPEETRRGDPVLVRFRYRRVPAAPESLEGLGSLVLDAPTFPTDTTSGEGGAAAAGAKPAGSVPVARFTRNLYLPASACYVDFDTDMTTHFERGGLFEGLKELVFGHLRETEGATAAEQAVQQIHQTSGAPTGAYPLLDLPEQQGGPRLLEKLDGQARLRVVHVGWRALYGLGVLALVLVVLGGAWLESKGFVRPVPAFALGAGTTFLLAVVAPRSLEPFLTTAFVGSVGLGGYWLLRGVWRELTVERHRRRIEALEREAAVAKARAQAAEAEAKAQAQRSGVVVTATEKSAPGPADVAAASRIGYAGSEGGPARSAGGATLPSSFEESMRSGQPLPPEPPAPPASGEPGNPQPPQAPQA